MFPVVGDGEGVEAVVAVEDGEEVKVEEEETVVNRPWERQWRTTLLSQQQHQHRRLCTNQPPLRHALRCRGRHLSNFRKMNKGKSTGEAAAFGGGGGCCLPTPPLPSLTQLHFRRT
jgi:hypothetical protein